MTRLLKTPIVGPCDAPVASSRIDMLGGLSKLYILRTPPDFCARAASPIGEISGAPFSVAPLPVPATGRLARQRSRDSIAARSPLLHLSCAIYRARRPPCASR